MENRPKSLTLDNSTAASHPGGLRANRFLWFRHYPLWPCIWGGMLVMCIVLAFVIRWVFWVPAFVLLIVNWFYWRQIKERFLYGCVNPAVIVSEHPMLIAAYTDLSKGVGDYPAIKIFRKNLADTGGQSPRLGSRLAVISTYAGMPDGGPPYWIDFDPRPVNCVTTDLSEIERIIASLESNEWTELEATLRQVPQPYRTGLFRVQDGAAVRM